MGSGVIVPANALVNFRKMGSGIHDLSNPAAPTMHMEILDSTKRCGAGSPII